MILVRDVVSGRLTVFLWMVPYHCVWTALIGLGGLLKSKRVLEVGIGMWWWWGSRKSWRGRGGANGEEKSRM